ncbi:MAG: hypothetical protein KY457_00420 [Actinobacteria bacterium]|nr:hypothetical protein [Actinomycetota bacterium]
MRRRRGERRPVRLTRRGRVVASGAVVGIVALALVAVQEDPSDVQPPGFTTGAAVVVPAPSPSPSPAGPAWRPAVATPLPHELGPVAELTGRASVVVVADVTDRRHRDLATWLAVQLQAPVVPVPGSGPAPGSASAATPGAEPDAELPDGVELVVAVGEVAVPDGPVVRRVPRAPSRGAPADVRVGPVEVRRAVTMAGATAPPPGADLSTVADLLDEAAVAGRSDVLLLARPGGATSAEVATALALGHRVVLTGADDPRADGRLRAELAGAGEEVRVGLLGAGWEDVDLGAWTWKLDVVRRGQEVPGGGQLVFPGRMVVALYGHPDGPALGVLGEQPLAETLVRAAAQAAAYDGLVEVPVVPALEIIATVASAGPGPDGDYSRVTSIEQLRPYVDAAREAGVFVVLDLQPGRTDFLTQARHYEELLREPHVGLALDPEWRLGPNDRHLVRIGSVGAAEVNAVVTWLAELTRRESLPQKLLVLHQFKHSMITDRGAIDTSRDELAMVLHVDGQGGQPAKLATYASMLRDLSPAIWVGWKNFHDEDRPMRSEAETVTLDPLPVLVTYQ